MSENSPSDESPPPLLKAKGRGRTRTLIALDANGHPTKIVTHGELLQGLFKQKEIEISVQEGKRPKQILCSECKVSVTVAPRAPIPSQCQDCRKKAKYRLNAEYRERMKAESSAWAKENREKANASRRRWAEKNKAKRKVLKEKSRAKRAAEKKAAESGAK